MAGGFKGLMNSLGMADVDDEMIDTSMEEEVEVREPEDSLSPSASPYSSAPAYRPQAAPQYQAAPQHNSLPLSRITTIHPKSYDDAQEIGKAIRKGFPVVLNLTDVSESVAYRIVDFSSGVVYGLNGVMQRITPRVFLLCPPQVKINREDARSAAEGRDLF